MIYTVFMYNSRNFVLLLQVDLISEVFIRGSEVYYGRSGFLLTQHTSEKYLTHVVWHQSMKSVRLNSYTCIIHPCRAWFASFTNANSCTSKKISLYSQQETNQQRTSLYVFDKSQKYAASVGGLLPSLLIQVCLQWQMTSPASSEREHSLLGW